MKIRPNNAQREMGRDPGNGFFPDPGNGPFPDPVQSACVSC